MAPGGAIPATRCCREATTGRQLSAMTQTNQKGFNLSKWALDHPALTRYLMVVLMLLGFAAYFQLGRTKTRRFFRAMVVHLLARRHGAAGGRAGDRQDRAHAAGGALRRQDPQLLRRASRRSFPDQGFIAPERGGQRLVPRCARRWATCATRCRRASRAVLQRRLWRCVWRDLRAGVRGLQLRRAEGVCRRRASSCCACAMWPRSSCLACRTKKKLFIESRKSACRSWGWT